MTKQLLMGNEAMAYAALEAGVRVAAGYPGTPSSEIIETIARLRETGVAQGVHVEWSANEKVALELLGGASLAGARGLFTCKQMGLNVASDPLMCLNYVGVRGGLVLIVADDPGPISSQTEQDTRRFAAFAKVPVLDPATPEQAYEMVKAAFELSEAFGTPVIVRPTTRVDHASAFFDVPDQTIAQPVPEDGFERDPARWVIFPKRSFAAHGDINERLPQMAWLFSEDEPWASFNGVSEEPGFDRSGGEDPLPTAGLETGENPVGAPQRRAGGRHAAPAAGSAQEAVLAASSAQAQEAIPSAQSFGIVASGVSVAYAREALRILRERAQAADVALPACRFMQVGTPYPFPKQAFFNFADGLTDILVLEELDYVLEDELLRFAGRMHATFNVHGKLSGEARDRGENDVDDIVARIAAFLGVKTDAMVPPVNAAFEGELPVRPPVLCPGCPHRGSFYAVKCAIGSEPAVLCGDIGCYTLGNAKPLEAVDTCLCMGAGITMAQGIAAVDAGKKAVAFVGDSTFFASGMPGLANAAYNGHDITVVVLDNATTAMTGSQPHPGTGVTLMGEHRPPLSIENVLRANGFTRIYRANPLDKDAALIAAKAAIAFAGPSAVIFESPCIQLTKPSAPYLVDNATCIGCKKCITEIGCPAISFDASASGLKSRDRGQAVIDPAQCNGCGLCAQICPAHAMASIEGERSVASAVAVSAVEAAAAAQAAQAEVPVAPAVLDRAWPEKPHDAEEPEEEPELEEELESVSESEPAPAPADATETEADSEDGVPEDLAADESVAGQEPTPELEPDPDLEPEYDDGIAPELYPESGIYQEQEPNPMPRSAQEPKQGSLLASVFKSIPAPIGAAIGIEPEEDDLGYTGSEVFLDIPLDDEEFDGQDWYSWRRSNPRD